MMVRTLKAHNNGYGKPFRKTKGNLYDHPAPRGLIKAGLVEAYEGEVKIRGRKRPRKSAVTNENGNGKKRDKAGGEASS